MNQQFTQLGCVKGPYQLIFPVLYSLLVAAGKGSCCSVIGDEEPELHHCTDVSRHILVSPGIAVSIAETRAIDWVAIDVSLKLHLYRYKEQSSNSMIPPFVYKSA